MEVCPTDVLLASAERIWHLLTDPCTIAQWTGTNHAILIWMALGIAYGAYRRRGFKAELVSFGIPEETNGAADTAS